MFICAQLDISLVGPRIYSYGMRTIACQRAFLLLREGDAPFPRSDTQPRSDLAFALGHSSPFASRVTHNCDVGYGYGCYIMHVEEILQIAVSKKSMLQTTVNWVSPGMLRQSHGMASTEFCTLETKSIVSWCCVASAHETNTSKEHFAKKKLAFSWKSPSYCRSDGLTGAGRTATCIPTGAGKIERKIEGPRTML